MNAPKEPDRDRRRLSLALAALPIIGGGMVAARRAQASTPIERVVIAGGSLTEIVYALGAERLIVGCDTTSLFPEAATKLPKIGYFRQLSAEGILALRPQLLLALPDAGPPVVLKQLQAADVRVEIVPEGHRLATVRERILRIGQLLGRDAEARTLVARLDRESAELRELLATAKGAPPRVLFILSHGGSPQIAGEDTAAAAMIALAGAQLATGGFTGYRPLTPEAAASAAPDAILTTSQGIAALGSMDKILALPGLGLTPAGRARRVVALDALLLLGFGPRSARAARDLALALREGSAAGKG